MLATCGRMNQMAATTAGTPEESRTVNVPTAARMLGISRTYAFQLAREGRLPGAIRIGGRVVVSRAVLERVLNGNGDDQAPEMREPGSGRAQGSRGDDRRKSTA